MLLGIRVTIEGERVFVEGLESYSDGIKARAIPRALERIASGTVREALILLTGPARGLRTIKARKSGRQRAVPGRPDLAGGYPVPRLTGSLRRLLGWLGPNSSKEGFTTGPFDAVVYNSAEYAGVIHQGRGSSAEYGPRPFIDDALRAFNGEDNIERVLLEEIAEVKRESGLE